MIGCEEESTAPTIFRSPSLRGTMTSGDSLANERESFRKRQAAQTWGSLPSLPYETDSCTYVWTYIHTHTRTTNALTELFQAVQGLMS